tara:strand:+ start:350 stop:685 length:336 start_codon:yes stop_codon:yes gene_type:complete
MILKNPKQLDPSNFSQDCSTRLHLEIEGYHPLNLLVRLWVDVGLKWLHIEKIDDQFVSIDITLYLDPKYSTDDLEKIQKKHLEELKPYLCPLPRKGDGWPALSKLFKNFKH